MNEIKIVRPQLEELACVNPECEMYGQKGEGNLTIRKYIGKKKNIRYLRCRSCQEEFSERKNTPLWGCKIGEEKAVSIAEHLAEGNGIVSTARLTRSDPSTVSRLRKKLGKHSQLFHSERVKKVAVRNLQADERYDFAGSKRQPSWEAEVIDPKSKFVLAHRQGKRNEDLSRQVLSESADCLADKHQVALFTDGLSSYKKLFPQIFGYPYTPSRSTHLGRPLKTRYRVPRTAAHVQIVKHRKGKKLTSVEIRYAHGSHKRIEQALDEMSYDVPNTSAIERRNGTARLMNAAQHRKTLTFSKRTDSKLAIGWWEVTVYNWCRSHRSLR